MAVKDLVYTEKCLFVCCGGSCMKNGAEDVIQNIRNYIREVNLADKYHTVRTRCIGRCDDGPVAMFSPDNIWLRNIDSRDCPSLIESIQNDSIRDSKYFLYKMGEPIINSESIPTKYRRKIKEQSV
jgi:(2Fe-2S) ferredoxin